MRIMNGIRLLQWNLLLDREDIGYIDDAMKKYVTPVELLSWPIRCQAVARRLISKDIDVAFLEEVSPSMFESLQKALPDYAGWHAGMLDGGLHKEDMEVAMFAKTATIDVLGVPRCRRLQWMLEEGKRRETALLRGFGDVDSSVYVALSAAVRRRNKENSVSSVFVVAGTHFRWEYGDRWGQAAAGKPLQALAAVRHLMQHAVDAGAVGWALAGDINSPPTGAAYELLSTGRLSADHVELYSRVDGDLVLPDARPLRSAFKLIHGREPLFTRKKDSVSSQYCLDYIFIGGSLDVRAAGVGEERPPYGDGDGSDLSYLPNAEWPSDHLPIFAEFEEVSSSDGKCPTSVKV